MVKDKDGNLIPINDWDKTISQPGLIKGTKCGENRYVGVVHILEFYLPKGCEINIELIDSI